MTKYILGYIEGKDELTEFESENKADYLAEEWVSIEEAAKIREFTEANIRYLITASKMEGKKDGGR